MSAMLVLSNIAIRGATLVSKFLLVFFLAKLLAPEQVGQYGLITAAIGWLLYFTGYEFYTYANRELIGCAPDTRLALLRDQAVFYVFAYAVTIPMVLMATAKGWLPQRHAAMLLVILLFEHVSIELNRILVAVSRPLLAGVVLFLRGGAWAYAAIFMMWGWPEMRDLSVVLASWAAGGAAACLVGCLALFRLDRGALAKTIDWRWLARGVRVAAPFMCASLAGRAVFIIDRYMVEGVANLATLGAYVVFISMATAVLAFLDAGVIDFMYPRLVASAKSESMDDFKKHMRDLAWRVILATSFLVGACWIASGPVLHWLDNPVYVANHYLLKWLLLSIALYAVNMIPHVALYALGHDRPIVFSQIAGLVVFLLVGYIGTRAHGIVAVPWALAMSFFTVLVWKSAAYHLIGTQATSS
jgi:O-antigen/teichoic acid export membrane protein